METVSNESNILCCIWAVRNTSWGYECGKSCEKLDRGSNSYVKSSTKSSMARRRIWITFIGEKCQKNVERDPNACEKLLKCKLLEVAEG